MRPEREIAANAGLGRVPEVERLRELVRVRARRRIDDRVCAVDDLELLVAPGRLLGALVGAVADLGRWLRQRLSRIRGVEDELCHLPVALVRVVEVVEGVEEPVLERNLVRVVGILGNVRVDGRLGALGEPA